MRRPARARPARRSARRADRDDKFVDSVRDSILREDKDGPYACPIAVREADKDLPWVSQSVKACQTDDAWRFIESQFGGAVIAAF